MSAPKPTERGLDALSTSCTQSYGRVCLKVRISFCIYEGKSKKNCFFYIFMILCNIKLQTNAAQSCIMYLAGLPYLIHMLSHPSYHLLIIN